MKQIDNNLLSRFEVEELEQRLEMKKWRVQFSIGYDSSGDVEHAGNAEKAKEQQ